MPTELIAGDASNESQLVGGNDGTLVVRTGLAGSKVTAVSIGTDGKPSFPQGLSGMGMVLGTAQATTSGTAIDFTGIPSWVKRITVMFNGVSTNGLSNYLIQIGAGSVVNTGYSGCGAVIPNGISPTVSNYTTGFGLASASASNVLSGCICLYLLGSNIWVCNGVVGNTSANVFLVGGVIPLGGTLDRIRITTVNGTDTFDAGSVNILYEG